VLPYFPLHGNRAEWSNCSGLQSVEFVGRPVVQTLGHDRLFHMQSPLEKRLDDHAPRTAALDNVQPICPSFSSSRHLLSQPENHEGEIVQTSAVAAGERTVIDWTPIELAVTGGLSFSEAAERFGVKEDSIRKRAGRHRWILPKALSRIVRNKLEKAVEKVADDWIAAGESHRKVAFDLAHESLKKMKPHAPKNFREADAADRIARRAAGLDNSDMTQHTTLIRINESVEEFDSVYEVSQAHGVEPDHLGFAVNGESEIVEARND
jgi:hypothetical protein